MRTRIFMFYVFGLLSLIGYSQEQAPQSPSVSGLMNFESNPVDLNTGIPSISIPLYTMPTRSKDISINIGLSYHPLSVAVFREKEGDCGRGWTMFKGGSVAFDGDKSRKWEKSYEFLHDNDSTTTASTSGHPAYGQFNFMGYSGKFEVKMNLTSEKLEAKVTENDNEIVDMKVIYTPATYKISTFIFYDTKGYAYVFSIRDTYINVFSELLDVPGPNGQITEQRRISTASAYHLSHIYDTNEYNFDPLFTFGENSLTPGEPLAIFNYSHLTNHLAYHQTGEYNHIKILSGIEVPGMGSVTFAGTSLAENTDVMTYTYFSMNVTNSLGKFIKKYSFTTEFQYNQLASSIANKRLTKIREQLSGDEYNFSYDYYPHGFNSGYQWNSCGYINAGDATNYSEFASNDIAKHGVLQKMTLPTGGCIIYDYELNTYSFQKGRRIDCRDNDTNELYIDENFYENDDSVFNNHNKESLFDEIKKWYQGPGIRIKRIAYFDTDTTQDYYDDNLTDQYTPVKEITYDYTLPNEPDMSSGSLSSYWPARQYNDTIATHYQLSSIVRSSLGAMVNYSNVRVTSTEDNGGYTEYSFISNNQITDCLTTMELSAIEKPKYKIGKLQSEKIYNAAGVLQQETTYTYDFNEIINVEDSDSGPLFGYTLGWAGVTQVNKKFYHPSGMIESTDNYAYYPNRKINTHTLSNSRGDILTTKYYYHELNSNNTYFKNRIQPEIVEQYSNQELLSTSKINYANNWNDTQNNEINNAYLPASTQVSKGSNPLITTVHFNKYDKYGHILEFEQEDGLKVAYIWGYQDSQIIAKIEGISSYTGINPTLLNTAKSATDSASSTEADILTALDNLRNDPALAGTVITTYTHIPLVGVSTITDARGYRTTYEYDSSNRLKLVKDDEGNILSENEYHIKPQN